MLFDLKKKTIKDKGKLGYKIYKSDDSSDFEMVEAATVVEALSKTTVKSPARIEKIGIVKKNIFTNDELKEVVEKTNITAEKSIENGSLESSEENSKSNIENNSDSVNTIETDA